MTVFAKIVVFDEENFHWSAGEDFGTSSIRRKESAE
jgi:hypothetical protein